MPMPPSLALVESRVVARKALFFAHVGSRYSGLLFVSFLGAAKNRVCAMLGSFSLGPPTYPSPTALVPFCDETCVMRANAFVSSYVCSSKAPLELWILYAMIPFGFYIKTS
jgi:hypothetical protein